MCSPVLGWGEARGAAAAIAGEWLPGGTHVVMAEGQEAAGRAGVQHARAVEEGEAALGQGGLEGTGSPLSVGCTQSSAVPSLLPEPPGHVCVCVLAQLTHLSWQTPKPDPAFQSTAPLPKSEL